MKNYLIYGLIGTSIFFTACGGSSSVEDAQTLLKKEIQGTYIENGTTQGCKNDEIRGTSRKRIFTFSEKEILFNLTRYSELNCEAEDLEYNGTKKYVYEIGEVTKAADNKDAYKMNITQTGFILYKGSSNGEELEGINQTYYTMMRYENKKLYLAKDDEEHNATSEATRANKFDENKYLLKIK